jgi:Glycosyltransferase family 29 (sialyltransferase)
MSTFASDRWSQIFDEARRRCRLVLAATCLIRRRIALVGNGPVSPEAGPSIDSHDVVIRFNSCSHYGNAGYRTDILVICNSGNSGNRLANTTGAIAPAALAATREFWFTKAPSIIALEETIANGNPALSGDYKDALIARHVAGRPWQVIEPRTYRAAKRAIEALGADATSQPSSGLLAIFHIGVTYRRLPRVTLYGFTHKGWHGHAWLAERSVIDESLPWITRSRLRSESSSP